MSDKRPSKTQMKNDVITELREADDFRYDIDNDILYQRHGLLNIWVVDHKKTDLYKVIVYMVDRSGYGYILEPKDLDIILDKFIKMTRDIHILHSKILSQFTDDDYMTINLPLKDKVLVINRNYQNYEVRDYDRNDFFTVFFKVDWVEGDPKTPKFNKFMKWFQNDAFLRDYLLKSAGMLYIPLYGQWNNIVYLYGNGNNGKSVYTDIVASFYDDTFKSFSRFEEISDNFGLESIYTKWLNVGEESKPKFDEDLSNIRVMASHGITDVRRKHKTSSVGIRIKTKGMFNGNVAPLLKNDGDYRRIGIIACRNKIENRDLDTDLTRTIIEEEGDHIFKKIILKAIEAMDNIKNERNKFIDIAGTQMEFTVDPIKYFVDNFIEYDDKRSSDFRTALSVLYEGYLTVAEEHMLPKFSQRAIVDKIRHVFGIKGSAVVKRHNRSERGLKYIMLSDEVGIIKQLAFDKQANRFDGFEEEDIEELDQTTEQSN